MDDETTTTSDVETQTDGGQQMIGDVAVDEQGTALTDPSVDDDDDADNEPQPSQTTDEADEVESDDTPTPAATELDPELAAWAEKKGLDPSDPNTLLKAAREAEKAMHTNASKRSELEKQLSEQPKSADLDYDEIASLRAEMQEVKTATAITNFYLNNPDARQLDDVMGKMVTENPRLKAAFADGHLGVEDIYLMAKGSQGAESLKTEGGREALQSVAKKLKANAPTAAATTPRQSGGITAEAIENMSLDEYRKRQPEIDAWLQAGGR